MNMKPKPHAPSTSPVAKVQVPVAAPKQPPKGAPLSAMAEPGSSTARVDDFAPVSEPARITYWLKPTGGYPGTAIMGEPGLADEEVRNRAIEQHRKVPISYPLDPGGYETLLRTAEVRVYKDPQVATQAEAEQFKAIRDRSEILMTVLDESRPNRLTPSPWINHVVAEVVQSMGVEETNRQNCARDGGSIPKEWDLPVPVNGPAGLHVRRAVAHAAEAIWLNADMPCVDAIRRHKGTLGKHAGEEEHRAWLGSHQKFQWIYEDRRDRHPNDSELDVMREAYDTFVDKTGTHLLKALTQGAGNLNPRIYLTRDGHVQSCTELGGYPLYYLSKDGGVLSPEAVDEKLELTNNPDAPDWFVVGAEVNYEDPDLFCDHSGKRIPSAYAEDTVDENEEPGKDQ